MHVNVTYIAIVLVPQHVSVLQHHLQGVVAILILKAQCLMAHKMFTIKTWLYTTKYSRNILKPQFKNKLYTPVI
jgi:hypothetical protein